MAHGSEVGSSASSVLRVLRVWRLGWVGQCLQCEGDVCRCRVWRVLMYLDVAASGCMAAWLQPTRAAVAAGQPGPTGFQGGGPRYLISTHPQIHHVVPVRQPRPPPCPDQMSLPHPSLRMHSFTHPPPVTVQSTSATTPNTHPCIHPPIIQHIQHPHMHACLPSSHTYRHLKHAAYSNTRSFALWTHHITSPDSLPLSFGQVFSCRTPTHSSSDIDLSTAHHK